MSVRTNLFVILPVDFWISLQMDFCVPASDFRIPRPEFRNSKFGRIPVQSRIPAQGELETDDLTNC